MYKKIGISVLITILFVVITGLISNTFFELENNIFAFRDLKLNLLLWDAIYVFFGLLLGIPVIIRLFMKSGKWKVDFYYLLVPILLLIIGIYPLFAADIIYWNYLGFIGNSFRFSAFIFIGFGYSLSLLVNKDSITTK